MSKLDHPHRSPAQKISCSQTANEMVRSTVQLLNSSLLLISQIIDWVKV